jgi:DNA-binding CsgD family transcriptional regulator
MVALTLGDREQAALRALNSAEPVLGAPLPTTELLEKLAVLLPCDAMVGIFADNRGYIIDRTDLPSHLRGWRDDQVHSGRPFYIGIMHWAANPLAAEACGVPIVGRDALAIGFRNGPDHVAQLCLDRDRGQFNDRDLTMLNLLAPILQRLFRERPTPELPASLTVAERRVLMFVEAGYSNAEIAAFLFVAPSTVRKHLENSFRKLGVNSRLAAVARLQRRDTSEIQLRERILRHV